MEIKTDNTTIHKFNLKNINKVGGIAARLPPPLQRWAKKVKVVKKKIEMKK